MEPSEFKYQSGTKGRGLKLPRRLAYGARAILSSPVFITERSALLGRSKARSNRPSRVMDDISNATNGYGLERISKVIQHLVKKQTAEFDKSLNLLKSHAKTTEEERLEIVSSLRKSGFAVIPGFTSPQQAENLYEQILAGPGRDRRNITYANQGDWLVDKLSPRIDADRTALQETVSRSELDFASLLLIAREYLNCRPIQLGPNSWTTKATAKLSMEEQDENAMAFHSDSDFFGFVKAFLLLTPVGPESGPFTFVAGSHLGDRQVQGRLKDKDLGYSESDLRFGTGNPGDLVLAVTTGWHKASIPRKGHRMMVQWLFTNTLFGSPTQ